MMVEDKIHAGVGILNIRNIVQGRMVHSYWPHFARSHSPLGNYVVDTKCVLYC